MIIMIYEKTLTTTIHFSNTFYNLLSTVSTNFLTPVSKPSTDIPHLDYYYSSSSNLRAHGVCDYGTLPILWQDLSSYLTTYIYKYIRPFRMIFFFCPVTVKLSNCLLRSRDSECWIQNVKHSFADFFFDI